LARQALQLLLGKLLIVDNTRLHSEPSGVGSMSVIGM
jgi:hypothetical protein